MVVHKTRIVLGTSHATYPVGSEIVIIAGFATLPQPRSADFLEIGLYAYLLEAWKIRGQSEMYEIRCSRPGE